MYNSKVTLTLRRSKSRVHDINDTGGGDSRCYDDDALIEVDNFSQAGRRVEGEQQNRFYFGQQQSDPGPSPSPPPLGGRADASLGLNVPAQRRAEALRILSPTPPPLSAKPVLQHAVRVVLFLPS